MFYQNQVTDEGFNRIPKIDSEMQFFPSQNKNKYKKIEFLLKLS